jgi:glycosyltransferase involved in cell wall biosynthesis
MHIGIAGNVAPNVLASAGLPRLAFERAGGSPSLSALALLLHDRGHEMTVFSCVPDLRQAEVVTGERLTVCLIPMRPRHRGRDLYSVERAGIAAMMHGHPVDVLNAHWSYEYALAALDVDPDAVITVRDDAAAIFRYYRDAYRAARWVMNCRSLARARYVTVNSPYMQTRLPPAIRRKSIVIPNFVNRPPLSVVSPPRRERHGIVTVAQDFSARKNVEAAMRAVALLRSRHPDLVLRLIGVEMGPDGPAARWAALNGLSEGVRFLGPLPYPEVMHAIAQASVLLHPSREESFGMVVLEAMQLGTPVVAVKDAGAIPYVVGPAGAGSLCDADDTVGMADRMHTLLEFPSRADDQAAKAQASAARFAPELIVPMYEAAYEHVLARKSGDHGAGIRRAVE